MIRECTSRDLKVMLEIINRAAQVYKGVIPSDRWKEPYVSRQELEEEISAGVKFYGWQESGKPRRLKSLRGKLVGVMGIQEVGNVTLIRHAYVEPESQRQGTGSELLKYLKGLARASRLLVGTWKAASWAIKFYEKHGFNLVSTKEKDTLLAKYWDISRRQIETSVVLEFKRQ